MARKYYERRAIATELLTYLQGMGYNISEVREGYDSIKEVEPPLVVVTFLPTQFRELEMGRTKQPLFLRHVQIDCFMENEPRADSITDDIGDFIDQNVLQVVDQSTSVVAYMRSETETITLETTPPNEIDPLWRHWRGVIHATYEVQYIN